MMERPTLKLSPSEVALAVKIFKDEISVRRIRHMNVRPVEQLLNRVVAYGLALSNAEVPEKPTPTPTLDDDMKDHWNQERGGYE